MSDDLKFFVGGMAVMRVLQIMWARVYAWWFFRKLKRELDSRPPQPAFEPESRMEMFMNMLTGDQQEAVKTIIGPEMMTKLADIINSKEVFIP